MADEVTLTLPREPEFQRVAHLVLGGLAVRLNLTIENLEDIADRARLAARAARTAARPHAITVRMSPTIRRSSRSSGRSAASLLDEIDRDAGNELGLRRVLESTVDEVEVDGDSVQLDDAGGAWLRATRFSSAATTRRRPAGARAADRAVHVARPLARAALQLSRRAARRPRADRVDRADQGDRPVRPRARGRADDVRDAEHHRRDQAPLPRPRLGGARAARAPGAERAALEDRRAADGAARALADDPRAREGCRRRGGGGARGARVRPRVLVALALVGRRHGGRRGARSARVARRDRARVRGVGGPRRARARASRCSTSASARSCTCASSRG